MSLIAPACLEDTRDKMADPSQFDEDGIPIGVNALKTEEYLGSDSSIRGLAKSNLSWMLKKCSRGTASLSETDKYASLELWYFALQIFNPEAASVFVVPSSCLGASIRNKYFDNVTMYSHMLNPDQVPLGRGTYPCKFKVFLIPVLYREHITVMAYSVADKTFYCYDSLAGEEHHSYDLYCSMAFDLARETSLGGYEQTQSGHPLNPKGLFGDITDCNIESVIDGLPQQPDRWSCGFYAIAFSLLVIRAIARGKYESLGKLIRNELSSLVGSFHDFVERTRVFIFDVMTRVENLYSLTLIPLANIELGGADFANLSQNFLLHRIASSDVLLAHKQKKLTSVIQIYLLQRCYGVPPTRDYFCGTKEAEMRRCLFLRVESHEKLRACLELDAAVKEKFTDPSILNVVFVETGSKLLDVPVMVLKMGSWKKLVIPHLFSEYLTCVNKVTEYFSLETSDDILKYYDVSEDTHPETVPSIFADPFSCQLLAFCGLKTFLDAVVTQPQSVPSHDTLDKWFEYSFSTAVINAFVPQCDADTSSRIFKRNSSFCSGRLSSVLNLQIRRIIMDSAICSYTFLPVCVIQRTENYAKLMVFFSRDSAVSHLKRVFDENLGVVDVAQKLGKRVMFSRRKREGPKRKSRKILITSNVSGLNEDSSTDGELIEPFLAMISIQALVTPDRSCHKFDSESGTHYALHSRLPFSNSDRYLTSSVFGGSPLMMRNASILNLLELQDPLVGNSTDTILIKQHRGIISRHTSGITSHSIPGGGGWDYITNPSGIRRKGERQCIFPFPWRTLSSVTALVDVPPVQD